MEGYIDRAYTVTNNTLDTKDAKAISSSAGTTSLRIKGSEDLGGGLSAGFLITTDWADLSGANLDAAAATASSIQTGGFANSQSYLEMVSKSMGKVQLGTVNNEILTATTGVAAPAFSTGVGSAYSSAWSTHDGYGTGGSGVAGLIVKSSLANNNAGVRGIRQANTIKYVSPDFSGVTFAYGISPKNDPAASADKTDNIGVTDMSVRYKNGPLDVMYASLKYDVGQNALANTSNAAANTTNTQTMLGASYQVMPTLKLHTGMGQSKASAATIANSKSTQYGVTWNATPMIDVMAQVASVKDDSATSSFDRKMTGLGVDYKFSKTTRAYVRYDNLKYNDGAATAVAGDSVKRTAIGVSKSF